MKKNNLLASMAGKALALAAAMMMSMAFTACSSDDEEDISPTPEPITNTVTIDGKTMPVVSAEYESSTTPGAFRLFLNLSQDGKTYVMLCGNTALHIGKDIDLTVKEPKGQDFCWVIGYRESSIDDWLLQTNGNPKYNNPPFTSGTLRIDGDPLGGEASVILKNGKIVDETNGDGKTHTISISWKGKATKI